MKRYGVALLLCLALLLGGCTAPTPAGDTPATTVATTTTTTTVTTTAPTTTAPTTTAPTTAPTPPPSTDVQRELTADELATVQAFLNDPDNNGFVSDNFYSCPEEISLTQVFYDGIGADCCPSDSWTEEERQYILDLWNWEEFYMGSLKVDRQQADAYLQAKCGLSLADFPADIPRFHYVEKFDAYYGAISDSNDISVALQSGYIGQDGLYRVVFEEKYRGFPVRVTLRPVDKGYQFVSCTVADVTPGPMGDEDLVRIQAFLREKGSYGFIGPNEYAYGSEIDPLYVFYDGAGLNTVPYTAWSAEERVDIMGTGDWDPKQTVCFKIDAQEAYFFFVRRCNSALTTMDKSPGSDFPFKPGQETILHSEAYNAYYILRGAKDYAYQAHVLSGEFFVNGNCRVQYSDPTGNGAVYEVHLYRGSNGYEFLSNEKIG